MSGFCCLVCVLCLLGLVKDAASADYAAALTKSLLFYEAQRSGKLPPEQRVQWRSDSALFDGQEAGVDLVGGYYDAGDNVKFGFPSAFTVTMLSWSVVEFGPQLQARNELRNALAAVKWGTDYLIKAHPEPNLLYGQVGDGKSDHNCWQRAEDIGKNRTVHKIDEQHPGSDLAAETAAAFAAASIAFSQSDSSYSSILLNHAKQLFDFATKYTGLYQNSIPDATEFYKSSGYKDELLWAAAWLARATNDISYVGFLTRNVNFGTSSMFSWDDKNVGAQVLVTKRILEQKYPGDGSLSQFKTNAEQYVCNIIQKGNSNTQRTGAGLLWFDEWNNLQYVTSASFIIVAYADILTATSNTLQCAQGAVRPEDLIAFARSQVDYILGTNPKQMSYMVGVGSNYPKRVHHRGASIVSFKTDATPIECNQGFEWYNKDADNPNVLDGAVVGGPNKADGYSDERKNYRQGEAATANNAPFVGVLARLAS
ncbi:endoglucanase 12-like [Sesamum indicum]|uniref:Endoglucanase n=1 Tax=Sesamum indicum TaxID=4182 RepID=A0A6I9T0A3_SESIN|nr:endoglucanase 12-like [Sesamum indicum]